jgi:hypothetical protein
LSTKDWNWSAQDGQHSSDLILLSNVGAGAEGSDAVGVESGAEFDAVADAVADDVVAGYVDDVVADAGAAAGASVVDVAGAGAVDADVVYYSQILAVVHPHQGE